MKHNMLQTTNEKKKIHIIILYSNISNLILIVLSHETNLFHVSQNGKKIINLTENIIFWDEKKYSLFYGTLYCHPDSFSLANL